MSDILKIGKYELGSRLIVGSGKYDSFQTHWMQHLQVDLSLSQ